jgi:DNA-binding PadR family transcriptional regulator
MAGGITLRIQQITGDVLQVRSGALYPALHRLEHQGWIALRIDRRSHAGSGECRATRDARLTV